MKILFVASEDAPYALVGGLSQAVSFLARAVGKLGHDVRVFLPKYGIIDEKKYPTRLDTESLAVPTGSSKESKFPQELLCNVKYRDQDPFYSPTYFLENREYFELRANIYGYADEHIRFYLLSLGCLEWLLVQKDKGGWMPDIIHAHDWHTGYLVELIKKDPRYKKTLKKIKVLYTVHNFRHQGNHEFQYEAKSDNGKKPLLPIFEPSMQQQNSMLRGIINADHVNTVSKKYAQEVQTKEFGEGLHTYLKRFAYKLSGIANGIDTEEINPETDPHIISNFNSKNLAARKANKAVLQKHFQLPVAENIPVIAYVGRLAAQKGIELILKTLEHIETLPRSQFIFLGDGEKNYSNDLVELCQRYPTRIAAILQKDFILPRKIFAGSDMLLVPSRFEPGGIVAMEALRYGSVPIVADTGGLSETITGFDGTRLTGNGFLHERKNQWSFFVALISALQIYAIEDVWSHLVKNALACDFSWDHTALEYQKLYRHLIKPITRTPFV